MKRFIALILVICFVFIFSACGTANQSAEKEDVEETQKTENVQTDTAETEPVESTLEPEDNKQDTVEEKESESEDLSQEDVIDDSEWDELEAMGKIESENGLFYFSITMPAEYVDEEITQESLDQKAGDTYTSAILNEDGSVTYKMTKKQHRNMLDGFDKAADEAFKELIDNPEYAFTEITHNKDYTSFDVHLSTEEIGLGESVMALGFYMYGGIYAIYSGTEADNVAVHYYSPNGELLGTGNSSEMGE